MVKTRYLKHFAEFQRPVRQRDASGETVETWEPAYTRYVDVRPLAVESSLQQNVNYEVSRLEMSTRYSKALQDEVRPGWRIVISNKKYSIDEVGDVFTRQKLSFLISSHE